MSGTLDEFPSWEGPGVGRFMGSLLSLLRPHSDHEIAPHPIPRPQDHPLPHWVEGRSEGAGSGKASTVFVPASAP